MQANAGAALERHIDSFYRQTRPEHAGLCRGMTGAWRPSACADTPEARAAPWDPPRPLTSHAVSFDECRDRCQRCARCRVFAYSQLERGLCVWHHACHNESLLSLDRRFEFWTFRAERVRGMNASLYG
mmetsp:Transcript_2256/g.5816  ORF Transcript_2256/g.5816 Transcript_2256/m.5816 type:complete len:128 (+) Transcript_2256:1463-1846(+)